MPGESFGNGTEIKGNRNRMSNRLFWAFLVVGMVLGGSGCGYRFGFTPLENVRTIAIPMFENNTFRRGLEMRLTKLVAREIERRTPYRVTSSSRADAVLRGTLVRVDESTLMEETEDGAAATGFTADSVLASDVVIRCKFRLIGSDGTVLVGPVTEKRRAEHIVARNETDQSALQEALADLAERIVWHLEAW